MIDLPSRPQPEEILSTHPFEAQFIFNVDGDVLSLTVDESLTAVKVTCEETTAE